MATKLVFLTTFCALLLRLSVAHEEDETHDHTMSSASAGTGNSTAPPSYFHHPHAIGWIYAHITLMILSWAFILPVAVMLRIARSRFCGAAQLAFHISNIGGLLIGSVYSASTPDLYPCNVHGVMGWITSVIALGSSGVYIFNLWSEAGEGRRESPFSGRLLQLLSRFRGLRGTPSEYDETEYRRLRLGSYNDDEELSDASIEDFEKHSPACDSAPSEESGPRISDTKPVTYASLTSSILDRSLLPIGFAVIVSGFVVYSGLFRGLEVYGGLSHWIKGGIFLWIGLLTLGRWIGAFADLGWAWNVKPRYVQGSWKAKAPSLEFVESFLIWLYGASNVFLEHLSNWGGEWSATDFEHISITVLFFGGGLLGMVVEAGCVRKDLPKSKEEDDTTATTSLEHLTLQQRKQEGRPVSLNPIPSLTIGLLGLMMSNHHQHTALGAAIHAQWGLLFFSGAFFRLITLLTLYNHPPSTTPARPLTELITAFCLTGGGILFTMSGRDSIAGLEGNKIVAMTAFTGTMGLAAVVLAWEVVVFGIKGWAEGVERRCKVRR